MRFLVTIDTLGAMSNSDDSTVLANHRVSVELSFNPAVFFRAISFKHALPSLLVEIQNCRAPVVMFLGATKQKKLDGVWLDAALLHPIRSMLGQSFQSIPLLLSETATLRRVVAQISSHYKN